MIAAKAALLTSAWAFSPEALAANLHNANNEAITVVVTEKGVRSNVQIAADTKASLCEKGCFITTPGGAILPLKGSEEVFVEGGKARIAKP